MKFLQVERTRQDIMHGGDYGGGNGGDCQRKEYSLFIIAIYIFLRILLLNMLSLVLIQRLTLRLFRNVDYVW